MPEHAVYLKRVELVTDGVQYLGMMFVKTDSSSHERKGRGHRQNFCCWFTALPVGVTARAALAILTQQSHGLI